MRNALAPDRPVVSPRRFDSFAHRIPIQLDNTGGPRREDWPIVLPVKALRAVAEDFNPRACAVVAPQRWIDWLEIPHQVDRIDNAEGRELSFLAEVPEDATATWYVHYAPTGERATSFAARTGAATWGPNVGWESTFATYRSHRGQFDFIGRSQGRQSAGPSR